MKKTVLVTGGFGYLGGGRVAQVFAALPDTHVVLEYRNRQVQPEWSPTASVVVTSWDDTTLLSDSCIGVDTVFHLVAGTNSWSAATRASSGAWI